MVGKRQHQLALTTGALASILLMTSTACTATKGYATPERLCGVAVDQDLLDSLFPPGKSIEQSLEEYGSADLRLACNVRVDSTVIVSMRGEWREDDATPVQVAQDHYPHAEQKTDDNFAAWPGGVATNVECRNSKKNAEYFSLITTVREADQKDFEKNADAFARDLTEKLIAKQPCEKG